MDIYERGDYFYFFMREIAEESNSDSQVQINVYNVYTNIISIVLYSNVLLKYFIINCKFLSN